MFDQKKLNTIYERTDGQCHLCRKKLARKNYGMPGARGAWEVEHSKPRSKGGTDHRNNLYAACVSCNRSKRNGSTRTARYKHGYRAAPFSAEKKKENVLLGAGVGGALAWILVPPQIKVVGAVMGAVLGGLTGANARPD